MSRHKKTYAAPPTPWWLSTPFVAIAALALFGLIAWLAIAIMNGDGSAGSVSPPQPSNQIGPIEFDGATQVLRMTATDAGYTPNEFQVEANKPVRLIVDGEAKGCASFFVSPKLGISTRLTPGVNNEFEFTPTPGRYEFSCSMGMFDGVIVAV